jgi:transcriptional/translational regulatory protein YebC/TACO1
MSGHSKWATTKHKKAVVDARRGKLFAKLIKNVEVAARSGGADLSGNPTLYDAVQKAKRNSVPNDNIDRAVRRGAGLEAGGAAYESVTYEGYAHDVVAAVLDANAEEVNDLGESFEVVSEATDLVAVRTALQEAGIDYESAEAAFLPSVEVPLDEDSAKRVFRLIEAIEDSDDVQDVYANYAVSDEIMEHLEHAG